MNDAHGRDRANGPSNLAELRTVLTEFEQAWRDARAGGPEPSLDSFLARFKSNDGAESSKQTVSAGSDDTLSKQDRSAPTVQIEKTVRLEVDESTDFAATIDPGAQLDVPESTAFEVDDDPAEANDNGATIDPASDRTVDATIGPTINPATVDPAMGTIDPNYSFEVLRTMDPSAPAPQVPDKAQSKAPKVKGYEILGELGRGGMGVVYFAQQEGLNRLVALKMILAGGHAGEDQLARFRAEGEAVAQLQHPNIVQIYDVGEQQGLPYFSLEFVDGNPLDKELDSKPLPHDRAAQLGEKMARAMFYAHERGIVHRDLKPANILMTTDGEPKITDFGLVKRMEDSGQTRTGTIMGTPSYMSPEQCRGEKDVGPAADIYALGAMLYELLTGRPPFVGATPVQTIMMARDEDPVPPSRLQPKMPADLETICLKCLQKEPEKRYETAEQLAEELRRFRAGEPILARPVTAPERLWRWCRRNPRVAIPSGIALVFSLCLMIGGPIAAFVINDQKRLAEYNEEQAVEARGEAETNATKFRQEREKAVIARNDAQAKEKRALTAEKTAKTNEKRAEQNALRAQQNAKLAQQQSQLALNALQKLVTEVQDNLRETPDTFELKSALLNTALTGLRQVAKSAANAKLIDTTLASAHQKMGKLFERLGQTDDALSEYQQFLKVIRLITKSNPNKSQANRYQAIALSAVGNAYLLQGNKQEAKQLYQQAFDLRAANRKVADSSQAQVDLATSHLALADVSEPAEAEKHLLAAFQLRSGIAAKAAPQRRLRRTSDLWISLQKLAIHYQTQERHKEALQHYEHALKLAQQMTELSQNSPPLRHRLASSYVDVGRVKALLGEDPQESYTKAAEILTSLAAEDPRNMPLQKDYALLLARLGQHQEATAKGETLYKLASYNYRNVYNVACCYALCLHAVDKGETLREQYVRRAWELLEQAVDRGYDDLDFLSHDLDLASLQGPDFDKKLAELRERVEASKKEKSE